MIRVSLIEGHTSFREALAAVLDREPELRVIAQAGSLCEARAGVYASDVAVLELAMPDGDGVALVGELCRLSPHPAVLVLTGSDDRAWLARAVEAGAAGALHKRVCLAEIIQAVRRLGAGERLLSVDEEVELRRLAGREREERARLARLTAREVEVLAVLVEGYTDGQIADRLLISARTSQVHVGHIIGKLGVGSRQEAIVFALRYGALRLR